MHTGCDSRHHDWPARPGHARSQQQETDRRQDYAGDIENTRRRILPPHQIMAIPRLHVLDGRSIDPDTGEVR